MNLNLCSVGSEFFLIYAKIFTDSFAYENQDKSQFSEKEMTKKFTSTFRSYKLSMPYLDQNFTARSFLKRSFLFPLVSIVAPQKSIVF